MIGVDENTLIDLGLLGVATLDEKFVVTQTNGLLAQWLKVGEVATECSLPLVGLTDELKALRQSPGTKLNLPDLSFGENQQQHFHTVNIFWNEQSSCYIVMTTVVNAKENYLVNATQLTRAKHFFDEQLLVERRHFRRIYEHSPQLAVCFHEDGHVVAVSEKLKQHYLGGVVPAVVASNLPSENALQAIVCSSAWRRVWRGERIERVALEVLNSDGEARDLLLSGTKEARPNIGGYEAYFILVDVTDRNQAIDSLQERGNELEELSSRLEISNHRFEQFATVAAHDLLAPLRRISRLSQIIGDEFKDTTSELLRSTLEELNKSAYQGRKLVNDVMELSRVTVMSSSREMLVPSDIMRIVEDEFRFDLQEVNASFCYQGVDMPLEADETLLFQIYRNLISNAIKYRDLNRELRIVHRTVQTESGVCIEVSDNGRGFDSQKYDVFAAFVRLVGKQEVQGTGIGLAIVKEAASNLGWRVEAKSVEGQGASFYLYCDA